MRTLDLQFHRIAQIQAELDGIRAAWVKRRQPESEKSETNASAGSEALLHQLRENADVSKEERRVISSAMAQRSAEVKQVSARAKQSAAKRAADSRNRSRRVK